MRCAALFDSRRRRLGAVLTGRPISELRQAYQALHQAHLELQTAQRKLVEQEKMASLGRLVAGVAHELNNPISFVYANIYTLDRYRKNLVSYLDAVHQGAGDDEIADLRRGLKIDSILSDIAPLLEGTLEGADRVSEIVKNLRRLSFSETGERHAVDLDRVLRNSAHLAVRAKNAMAEVSIDSDASLFVDAHEGQIHQVLVNLIANALDAVADRQNGRVDISTRQRGDSVEIIVSDNGPGIAETEMNKVFEPFFTTKDVGKGTGLGLAMVYGIIKQSGGYIYLESEVGEGTVFRIFLPRHAMEIQSIASVDAEAKAGAAKQALEAPPAEKDKEPEDLTGNSAVVLLVEDEDAVRRGGKRMLETRGYTVHEACSGVEALEIMEELEGKVDIVVSDVVMPEMDGPSLLKELRKNYPNLKFIFVSGYAEDAFARNLPADAKFGFLPKPFSLKQLAIAVREMLDA